MAKLSVEVVTGERVVYQEDDVDMVVVPGADGQLGILPSHAALISLLSLGEMRVVKGAEEQSLVVFGGFLEVSNDHVRVLADTAERADEIDLARAEAARERAEARLADRVSEIDTARAALALRRSMIRIRAGRRRRGRTPTGPGPGQAVR